ncbi:MAG: flagellar hook-basal body complex protein FliE [bacterium]|nr:flagellar hook-basal body complex protein FliE [bacterium]
MADPLGLIGGSGGVNPFAGQGGARAKADAGESGTFKDALTRNLDEVNRAQQEATRAVEDLMTGERSDLEGVILATRKADDAFRMLQSLRNRVMEAYDEVKQMRV